MDEIKVLYARKAGEPEYMEELITEQSDRIEEAKAWAITQGYTIFRIATVKLDKLPNFASTIN